MNIDQNASAYPTVWDKPPFIKRSWLRWSIIIGGTLYIIAALASMNIDVQRVLEGIPRGQRFIESFFPPNFSDNRGVVWEGILESIWMAIISTVACRFIIAGSRTFPEIILAIFAVKLFGFGPFAGFIALSLGTIGFFAKLLAEDIENSSAEQAEAVKSTGANWFQWINYAIQPQVMPRMIGLSVYRLDINFRESAVVGIVGGGGIGATLNTAFSRYEFDTAAAILLVIIGIVMVLEYASGHLRKWVQ